MSKLGFGWVTGWNGKEKHSKYSKILDFSNGSEGLLITNRAAPSGPPAVFPAALAGCAELYRLAGTTSMP